jgi:hypothetical protein
MPLGADSMNAEYEGAQPLKRLGPVPMIHWENGRACAGPRPTRPIASPETSTAPIDAAPSAQPPPSRSPGDA